MKKAILAITQAGDQRHIAQIIRFANAFHQDCSVILVVVESHYCKLIRNSNLFVIFFTFKLISGNSMDEWQNTCCFAYGLRTNGGLLLVAIFALKQWKLFFVLVNSYSISSHCVFRSHLCMEVCIACDECLISYSHRHTDELRWRPLHRIGSSEKSETAKSSVFKDDWNRESHIAMSHDSYTQEWIDRLKIWTRSSHSP